MYWTRYTKQQIIKMSLYNLIHVFNLSNEVSIHLKIKNKKLTSLHRFGAELAEIFEDSGNVCLHTAAFTNKKDSSRCNLMYCGFIFLPPLPPPMYHIYQQINTGYL